MKIGIITFHFPSNCGAALQCYALQSKLISLGHEVEIINYCPWYHQNRYLAFKNPIYFAKRKMREPARNILTRLYHGAYGFFWTVYSWRKAKVARQCTVRFQTFRKKHLHETRVYRTVKTLKRRPPKCDLYIAGSDQLWNDKLTDGKLDTAYFLDFGGDGIRRATYAVGTFFADPKTVQSKLRPLLERIDYVSLREEKYLPLVAGAASDRTRFHIDVDPTLLLCAADYESLEPQEPLQEGPFILSYTMPGAAQAKVNKAAKALSAATGVHLIDINGNPNAINRQIEDQRVSSPGEFLWYMQHASEVVTGSFHGTVFAILYHRPFVSVLHAETGNRVSELLARLGLSDRIAGDPETVAAKIAEPIDWDAVDARLDALRKESVRYLNCLCGGPDEPAFAAPEPYVPPAPDVRQTPKEESPRQAAAKNPISVLRKGTMYTDDKNAQVVLSLIKQYGIRKIVVSPGTTNVPISRAVQTDPFFEVYSMVDERSAAYFACGLAFATGEPVALSCTGATASRDYIPGLTEAYYRGLPVIAITSQHHSPCPTDLTPQMTDRSVSQNDVKRYAAILPLIKDEEDRLKCVQMVNKALYTATCTGGGPVHINLPVGDLYSFHTPELPVAQKTDVYDAETFPADELKKELRTKRLALFIGAHRPFAEQTLAAIRTFVKKHDAAVFCDHTANYTGENSVLSAVAGDLAQLDDLPDLIIDLGSVSGDYSATRLFKGRRVWRISEDREWHNRHGAEIVEKLFFCSEKFFFEQLTDSESETSYYGDIFVKVDSIPPIKLPFSNLYVASKLSERIPKNSFLHLGILNSLRSMNFWRLDPSVRVSCNVGGFGIDGAVSTAFGQSKADKKRLSFCLLGDLGFFYDMNVLGNRHMGNNLRILLVNNGLGVEFRLNSGLENQWGSDTDELIAAKGHFGSAKAWAESMGFTYMSAKDSKSFDAQIDAFCDADPDRFGHPVVFEVFTDVADEKKALREYRNYNRTERGSR